MDNDLISRSALHAEFEEYHTANLEVGTYANSFCADVCDVLMEIVREAPAVDAVEVVRCKYCKHCGWEQNPFHGRTECFCKLHKGLVCVTWDSFCSYGERRENETD